MEYKNYFMREVYQCVRYGKLSYTEVRRMPVEVRRWWLKQLAEENNPNKPKEPQGSIGDRQVVKDKPPAPNAPRWEPPTPHGLKVGR